MQAQVGSADLRVAVLPFIMLSKYPRCPLICFCSFLAQGSKGSFMYRATDEHTCCFVSFGSLVWGGGVSYLLGIAYTSGVPKRCILLYISVAARQTPRCIHRSSTTLFVSPGTAASSPRASLFFNFLRWQLKGEVLLRVSPRALGIDSNKFSRPAEVPPLPTLGRCNCVGPCESLRSF